MSRPVWPSDELDQYGQPVRVSVPLRYVVRTIDIGLELRATAPSENGRRVTVRSFSHDGTWAHVTRSTSRRRQAIKTSELARRYAPASGSRHWETKR